MLKRLEAELQLITAELESKDDQLRALMDAETYSLNDSRLTTIRSVMVDTIEAMRQYTLWSIA